MQEIVFNSCAKGEALLSEAGLAEYIQRKFDGAAPEGFTIDAINRADPVLIALIRENTDLYRGHCSQPRIISLPDNIKWEIRYRGNREWVAAIP